MSIAQEAFEQISADPAAYYAGKPAAVLDDERLSRTQKIAVLKLWAFDAHELEVAQAENMVGEPSQLQEVLALLRKVEAEQ